MSYPVETYERLAGEAREIIARYPEGHARSALPCCTWFSLKTAM